MELCAARGSTPACIRSAAENDVAGTLVAKTKRKAWLGLYQHNTSREPVEGWGRCVDGDSPSFTNWMAGEPNDHTLPEDCAVMLGKESKWADQPCSGGAYVCLCAGPSNVSDNFEQDLVKLEADLEARLHEIRAAVPKLYAVATVIALLPTLLMVGHTLLQLTINQRTRTSLVGVANTHEQASARMARWLFQARRSAVRRRLQVGQVGWVLLVYGILPNAMSVAEFPIDKVVEMDYLDISLALGIFLGLLTLFPTDERAIRTICTVFLALYLGLVYLYAHYWVEIGRHKGSFHGRSSHADCSSITCSGRFVIIWTVCQTVVHLSAAAALAATLPCGGCKRLPVMQPRQALRRMWAVLRLHFACNGMLYVGGFIAAMLADADKWDPLRYGNGDLLLGAVSIAIAALATPANRGRVTRLLGRLGSRGSEAEEAAVIAMLLGRANPQRALAAAEALFRCLPASRLTAEDLADSGATGSRRASPASMSAVRGDCLRPCSDSGAAGRGHCVLEPQLEGRGRDPRRQVRGDSTIGPLPTARNGARTHAVAGARLPGKGTRGAPTPVSTRPPPPLTGQGLH